MKKIFSLSAINCLGHYVLFHHIPMPITGTICLVLSDNININNESKKLFIFLFIFYDHWSCPFTFSFLCQCYLIPPFYPLTPPKLLLLLFSSFVRLGSPWTHFLGNFRHHFRHSLSKMPFFPPNITVLFFFFFPYYIYRLQIFQS